MRTFQSVKELCYQELDGPELLGRAGARLERDLGLSAYCLGVLDSESALPVHSISVGLGPDAMEAFLRLLLATPALDFGPWRQSSIRVKRLEDLVDNLDGDPYVTDILRPSGVRHEVQVSCTAGGIGYGHLCLRRRECDGPFEPQDMRLLGALAPHLAAGLRNAASREADGTRGTQRTGIIVLAPGGEVEFTSGVPEEWARKQQVGARVSYLTAVNLMSARLRHAMVGGSDAALPVLTATDGHSGDAYTFRGEKVTASDGLVRGVITIEPVRNQAGTNGAQAFMRLGLSAREAEVAVAAVRGQSAAEIATALVLSPHTVRDHLKNAYEKLGIGSRNELAMKLYGG